jgi:hypothetical protein
VRNERIIVTSLADRGRVFRSVATPRRCADAQTQQGNADFQLKRLAREIRSLGSARADDIRDGLTQTIHLPPIWRAHSVCLFQMVEFPIREKT